MSQASKLPFIYIPRGVLPSSGSLKGPSIGQRLKQVRSILIPWLFASSIAGWSYDKRKRSTLELAKADRQIRALESLVGELKAGKDDVDVDRVLVLAGLRERKAQKDYAETMDQRIKREQQELNAKPFLQRWFGGTDSVEQQEAREQRAWDQLKKEFNVNTAPSASTSSITNPTPNTTTSSPSSPSPSSSSSSSSSIISNSPSSTSPPPSSSKGKLDFVEGEKRAQWSKSFI
ncbi:hypothetical protein [Phaffia rhodozyma]|uniref:Uncharacterized protein n=1 Tax=Phaffia rhodozyma TaxID=264483 RepID=A0A0F7SK03_PHARH|nr:hypothetical protein [Phaffia rhodozyma]